MMLLERRAEADDGMAALTLAGMPLLLDAAGALLVPSHRMVVVADLHLEKGSAYAARGQFLPPYDSAETLARLGRLALRHRPHAIVFLGDSFHDTRAGGRMSADVRQALAALGQGRDLVWIAGNHDPEMPADLPGERLPDLRLGSLALRHEPQVHVPDATAEIAGHLHPAARVLGRGGSVRRRCFVGDGRRLILPAFGAYAGGLNVLDPAIARLFPEPARLTAHVCGERRVYCVGPGRLLGE
jgi:hypothetical protein